MNKKELRAKLIAEMRELDEKAKKENRSFTDDENKAFSEKEAEIRKLDAEIEAEERSAKLAGFSTELPKEEDENRSAPQNSFMQVRKKANGEFRDITMSVGDAENPGGGYTIAPEEFVNELIKEVEKEAILYNRVRKVPVSGAGSLGIPTEATDASDAGWTNEIPENEISVDSSWSFGKRELAPTDLTKQIVFTKKLLASSALPIDTLTRQKVSQKLVEAFESGIISGTGSSQPLGVFTASANGINTDRDVETETAGKITADDLIEVKMKLRPAYRRKAVWVMNTAVLKEVMKLKDDEGRYLWLESTRAGEPSTLLGLPVIESEFAPDSVEGGEYALILGDFSYYWFAYWKGIDIQVLVEKYAGKNQIGILGHTLADGQPVLPAAFARLKIKAS